MNGEQLPEISLYNYYTTESSPWRTAITGMCTNGISGDKTTTLGNAYNTAIGVKGSSTANITGIYDLNGCVWERTTAYISNGNASLSTYGNSYTNTTANTNGYQTLSTKWATVYPYNSSDSNTNNYNSYSGKKSTTYRFYYAAVITVIVLVQVRLRSTSSTVILATPMGSAQCLSLSSTLNLRAYQVNCVNSFNELVIFKASSLFIPSPTFQLHNQQIKTTCKD